MNKFTFSITAFVQWLLLLQGVLLLGPGELRSEAATFLGFTEPSTARQQLAASLPACNERLVNPSLYLPQGAGPADPELPQGCYS